MSLTNTNVDSAAVLDDAAIAAAEVNSEATDAAPVEAVAEAPEGTADTIYMSVGPYKGMPLHLDDAERPVDMDTVHRVAALRFAAIDSQKAQARVVSSLKKIRKDTPWVEPLVDLPFDEYLSDDFNPVYSRELTRLNRICANSTKFTITVGSSKLTLSDLVGGAAKLAQRASDVVSIQSAVTMYRG